MTDRTNLVGAPPGVPGAIQAASVPPLLDTLIGHAYAWVAANLPFEAAVDLSPVTRAADRTLRERGNVTTTVLRRGAAQTEMSAGCADLVVWAAPLPSQDGIEVALAEAKRLCRRGGAVVCVLPTWAAEGAAELVGLREDASVDLRPLIGAAIGDATAENAAHDTAPGGYRIVVMRPSEAPTGTESTEASETILRDGERALRVELAAHRVLQGVREDDRAELLARLASAEGDAGEQRDRAAELARRLEEAEEQLRDQRKAAEADAAQLRSDLDVHRRWVHDIQASLSWRLTKPLRRGKGTLGR